MDSLFFWWRSERKERWNTIVSYFSFASEFLQCFETLRNTGYKFWFWKNRSELNYKYCWSSAGLFKYTKSIVCNPKENKDFSMQKPMKFGCKQWAPLTISSFVMSLSSKSKESIAFSSRELSISWGRYPHFVEIKNCYRLNSC